MSKAPHETNTQNDSVDSGSITLKIGGLINRLKLFKEIGDITIVNTPLSKSDYSTALKEYDDLNTIAKKTTQFSPPANKAAFLSDLHKCQAIIAFRANSKDASTYLKEWKSANLDDFMAGLQTILEDRIKFLQETGDITKINTSLDSSQYESNKIICDNLVKTIGKFLSLGEIRTKLSFDLNKCQAISGLRAGKNKDVEEYLLNMRTADRLSTDEFILELEPSAVRLNAEYTKTKENEQISNNEQLSKCLRLYHYLQKTVQTKVAAHLKKAEYEKAYDEMMHLWK